MRRMRIALLRLSLLPVVAVALLVRPSWALESKTAFVMESAGYLFLLAGLAIRIWCAFYIGGRKSRQLVTEGPYSVSRNPLYMGTFLLVIGVGLCFENLIMLAICAAVVVPVHLVVVRMEERHLEQIFGDEFRAYKERVPRFWPSLRHYTGAQMLTVPTRIIARIALDAVGVLLLPLIEDLLELLHEGGVLPVLWHFP